MAQIIINKQNSELAFRLERFNDLSQFDHIQRKNYYSIILINGEKLTLQTDFSRHQLEGEYMVFISPYQPFMLTSESNCSGILLNFHPDFFCTYRHQNEIETEGILFHNFSGLPFLKVIEGEIFSSLINHISKEMERNFLAQHEVLVAFLKVFLIESVRQKKSFDLESLNKHGNRQTELLQDLVDLINGNFCTMHSPKEYAEKLCVSSKTLGGVVKKYLNQTTSNLIVNRIIVEAKRELYLTSKSVQIIAASLGYQDEFYFSRLFKKKVGVSPDIYRKSVGFARLEKG
ncbi:helix-turn-helix domain-containing protein [Aquimarina sp. 2304DJ70-9]|uniref:helix-turn-helix domain-containing protein n=1 Tax=Aquimarina penaris TaxID=3231044 RepID=UPI003462F473